MSYCRRHMPQAININNFGGSNLTMYEHIYECSSNTQLYHGAETSTQYMRYEMRLFRCSIIRRYLRYYGIEGQNMCESAMVVWCGSVGLLGG